MDPFEPQPVLFVDDEPPNRLLLRAALGDRVEIAEAGSGQEALQVLADRPIDVLLTDFRMPGMNGVELCEEVARRHPHVERLLVTAYADANSAIDAINRGGVSRYLAKPWNLDELLQILQHAQARAVRTRLVRRLQAEMLLKERASTLASIQRQVLHDLGNATSQLRLGFDGITELVDGAPELPPALRDALHNELGDVQVALGFLTELHGRVRGLHRGTAPDREPLRVADMLHSAAVLARASMPPGGRIEIDAPPDLVLSFDRTDLGRILVNLLTNAAQAVSGRPSPRVDVRAYPEGDDVVIDVRDNGPGVHPALVGRVFEERFTTKGSRGSGLGLSISRGLVEDHGGTLVLLPPDEPGAPEGAWFRLRVPALDGVLRPHQSHDRDLLDPQT